MTEIALIKERLINELWIPIAISGGKILYPRRKKNKRMKVLTLTHHSSCREADELIKNKLTNKELIVGWNKGTTEVIRLESERLGSVVGPYVYEESIIGERPDVQNKFPFDVLNLDFSSQNPELENGRLEREILGIEHTINLQANKGSSGMVLIYTTILNSKPLRPSTIKQNSDDIRINGWDELSINGAYSNILVNEEKIKFLEKVVQQVCSKHQYEIKDLKKSSNPLSDSSKCILSVGMLLKKARKYENF